MTWLLAYLLAGFVLHFVAVELMHIRTDMGWRWELAATVLWPIALICGTIIAAMRWKSREN